MNGDRLLEKIGDLDEKLILEAENIPAKKAKKAPLFIGLGTVAAAAAVALSVNFLGGSLQTPPVAEATDDVNITQSQSAELTQAPATSEKGPVINSNLPKLDYGNIVGSWGFEGFQLSDISEYENGNPYTSDMEFKTMLVLKSNAMNPDKEKMTEYLKTMAEKLGVDPDSLEFEYQGFNIDEQLESYKKIMEEQNVPEDEMEEELARVRKNIVAIGGVYVYGENEDVRLSVKSDYSFGIHFNGDGIALPEGYNKAETPQQREKTAEYLLEQYGYILQDLKNPVTDVYKENDIGFYEKGETDAENILNYCLNHSRFGIDEEGNLFVIWIDSTYGCEELGDYPVISPEEAKKELLDGRYMSSVILDDPTGFSEEDVSYMEIMYRMDSGSEYALPFYRFLVKLPEDYVTSDEGKSHYGAFYVPAVSKEYIQNPIISFNGAPIEMLPKE